MTDQERKYFESDAARAGIKPGSCPKCGTKLMPSNRIPVAKMHREPNEPNETIISFDCPVSTEHIEPADLATYYVGRVKA